MPEPETTKSAASEASKLAYLENISQTKLGLRSSSRTLTSLRGTANGNDTRTIDLQIDQNDSDWFRANQAEGTYYSRDVKFRAPTTTDLDNMRKIVSDLDAIIAANATVREVIAKTTTLVGHFNQTQA